MAGLENSMDNAENAQKVKVAKEDPGRKRDRRFLCKTESTQGRTARRCTIRLR